MDWDHFNTIASDYDATIPAAVARHYLEKRVRFFSGLYPRSALDLGCGTGVLAAALKNACPGSEVTGLDASQEMLAIAKSRGIHTFQSTSSRLPFADNQFDLVYCVAVMHHVG